MKHADILAYFEQKQPQILETIRLLVEEETPSDDKARLDNFAQRLADRYKAVGARVEIIKNNQRGDHVRAVFDNAEFVADPAAKPALILCHFDTVWPVGALATHPFRVDEQGWAYGPGIFDMQSSLALAEYMLLGVQEQRLKLPRPVVLLATSDEEVGSLTSRTLIEEEARQGCLCVGDGITAARRRDQNQPQRQRQLQSDHSRAGSPCRGGAGKGD